MPKAYLPPRCDSYADKPIGTRLTWVAALIATCALLGASCVQRGDESGRAPAQALGLRVGTPGTAQWAPAVPLSLVPASAALLPNGQVLFWASNSRTNFGGSGQTYTSIFDPATGTATETLVTQTGHDMFCTGTTNLSDGRILVNGGDNSERTSLFDALAGTWVSGGDMKIPRGYNANTLLQDGTVLTLGGSWSGGSGNKHGEVWSAATGWRKLTGLLVGPMLTADPSGTYRADNHMWLIPAGNGRVLHAGPAAQMNWIDTAGDGSSVAAGLRGDDADSMCGTAVMYDAGKILKVGGATAYQDVNASTSAYVLDVTPRNGSATAVSVRKLTGMAYRRSYHNSVVLPNGQVVIVGGQTYPVPFSDDTSVLAAELWDPTTETFTTLPAMTSPRNYHSVALLLPDGRVLSAGGGLCGGCATNHPDLQILTPPYLLNQDGTPSARPAITSAPSELSYGTSVAVTTDVPVTAFSIVRVGSTTHTVNNDQRRLPLTFTATGPTSYAVDIPSNRGIALPGYYMLFALESDGVPSVAKIVRLGGDNTPQLVPPSDQSSVVGSLAQLTIVAPAAARAASADAGSPSDAGADAGVSAADPVTFAATGLPEGLSINAATGVISGAATTVGSRVVTVTARNSAGAVSSDFTWTTSAAGRPRFVKLEALSEINNKPWTSVAELNLLDADGNTLTRSGWTVRADSEETARENGSAANAIDGNNTTMWHTEWSASNPPPPHNIVIDLHATPSLGGLRYLPRQGGTNNGTIARYKIFLSVDGTTWGDPVAQGDFSTDGAPATEKTVRFTVPSENHPPTVTVPAAQSTAQGQSVTLTVAASDPDGDTLTYAATGLPPGLTIDAATGVVSGSVTTAGVYTVVVTATDGKAGSGTANFTWTVVAPPSTIAPVLASPATAGAAVSYTADATGSGLTYSWDFGDGGPATEYSTAATASHTYAAAGLYTVTLAVKTADGQVFTRSFRQAVVTAAVAGTASSSSQMAIESRGGASARLWVVNPDQGSVSVFDTATNVKGGEVAVGGFPCSVAVAPGGAVWVVNRDTATVSVIDPASLTVTASLPLPRGSRPAGLVFAPGSSVVAYVSLDALGQVLRLSETGTVTGTVDVGPNPRGLALDASGARLLVSRFITRPLPGEATATVATTVAGSPVGGEVLSVATSSFTVESTVVLAHSEKSDSTVQGRGIPNYLGAAAISPDGTSAWVPSKQDNIKRGKLRDGLDLDFQNTVRAITSRVALATATEDLAGRVDHDNAGLASAAAFHPSGAYLFVALETSRQWAVVDPVGKREILRFEAGRAPQALAVSPDGLKLYVHNFMDRTVGVFDLIPLVNYGESRAPLLATLGTVASANEALSAAVLKGKQFFYDARDTRLARDGYLSCATCHRDGEHDGRVWDFTGFGEGLRNTISLKGRAGAQGPLHWSGNFDEVQDFEGQLRTLASGSGLMSDADFNTGTRATPLGDAKAGVSADLDALAAYVGSLGTFAPSPRRTSGGALTAGAVPGRAVFAQKCAYCHGGAGFTQSTSGRLVDIGTRKPSSGSRLGATLTGLDIPTLRDVWATAPYLHDGSAATVEDAIRAHSGVELTSDQLAAVAAFTGQIGAEEPAFAAAARASYVRLEEVTEVNGNAWGSMAEFDLVDADGATLSRTGWVASADSVELVGENGAAANALDGNANSIWHTQWRGANPVPPHTFTVKLPAATVLGGFRYLPRQTGPLNGTFARYRFYVSDDGTTWGQPIVSGDLSAIGSARAAKTVLLK